jgi:putative sigma-54 modulation protein
MEGKGMDLQITGVHTELSPETRAYMERKLGKLVRHLPTILEVKVEITKEKTKSPRERFVAQITVDANGTILRSEERGEELRQVFDRSKVMIDRQVLRYKGKIQQRVRRKSPARGVEPIEPVTPEKVIKRKRFNIRPMSVSEAIDAMEMIGHDFYLFRADDGEMVNLVYRRHDGNYGLIESQSD